MSEVWKFYEKVVGGTHAKCLVMVAGESGESGDLRICGKLIGRKGTSAQWNHLKLHGISRPQGKRDLAAILLDDDSNSSTSSATTSSTNLSVVKYKKFKQSTYMDNSQDATLARLAAKDGFSFHAIANSYDIRRLASVQCPNWPRSPNSVKNAVLRCAQEVRNIYGNEIREFVSNGNMVSMSFDEWTSCSNRRYINICLTSMTEEWNLGLMRVKGKCGSIELMCHLGEFLGKFGLTLDDVFASTMDGCKVNERLGRLIHLWIILCLAHGINLGVVDVLYEKKKDDEPEPTLLDILDKNIVIPDGNEDDGADETTAIAIIQEPEDNANLDVSINAAIVKVRTVVKKFRKSPLKNDALQEEREKNGEKPKNQKLDSRNRWGSLLDMLECFYSDNENIRKRLIAEKINISFSENEIALIKQTIDLLSPVKAAVTAICASDATLLVADTSVEFMLTEIAKSSHVLAPKLSKALIRRVKERRTILYDVMQTLFDNYKSSNIRSILSITTTKKEINTAIHSLAKEICKIECDDEEDSENIQNSSNISSSSNPSNDDESEANLSAQEKLRIFTKSRQEKEINTVPTAEADDNKIKQELKAFNDRGIRGPVLTRIYNCLKTVRPTSVGPERTFSTAGKTITKFRGGLADDSSDGLVLLKYYFEKMF